MLKSLLRLAGATALFFGLHTLFASQSAKQAATRLVGTRGRNSFYRLFYNGFALGSFAALGWYAARLPDRELYHVRGPGAWLMRLGQAFGLVGMAAGARQIGYARFTGLANALAWLRGDAYIPPEPAAQGPALDEAGTLRATGPFRCCRHPLNAAMLPVFWLMPRMTARLLLFNALMSVYAVLASRNEERHLLDAYGRAYADYQEGGTPFFLPGRPGSGEVGESGEGIGGA